MTVHKKAEVAADLLLQKLGITSPPVAVEDVAREVGARVDYELFEAELSGVLIRSGSSVIIGVNSTHSNSRQRFTIAHEIGHLKLHEGQSVFVDRAVRVDRRDAVASAGIDSKEIEANGFAAALLMPQAMLLEAVDFLGSKKDPLPMVDIMEHLSKRFDVSSQAMEYRLANLGIAMPSQ